MFYLKLIRPLQWIKNLLLFVPLIFAQDFLASDKFFVTLIAVVIFSLMASAMYVLNDLADRMQDKLHPIKKNRPLAAGNVSVHGAVCVLVALVGAAILLISFVPAIIFPIFIYVALNLLYSFYLKNLVVFDILIISIFYLLRIITGGLATGTHISRWLILCTIFASLLIIIGKRLSELRHSDQRLVLKLYPPELLKHLFVISAGLTVVSYGCYSVLGASSELMVYSTLLVVLGVFRYIYIVYSTGQGEQPERLIFSDKILFGSFLTWLFFVSYIFYF